MTTPTTTASPKPGWSSSIPSPDAKQASHALAIPEIWSKTIRTLEDLRDFKAWGCVSTDFAPLATPTITSLKLVAFAAPARVREKLRGLGDTAKEDFAEKDGRPEELQAVGNKFKHWVLQFLAHRCSREKDAEQGRFLFLQGLAVARHLGRTVGIRTLFDFRSQTKLPGLEFDKWHSVLDDFGKGKESRKALFAIAAFYPGLVSMPSLLEEDRAIRFVKYSLQEWDQKISGSGKKLGSAVRRIANYAARTAQPQLLAALWCYLRRAERTREEFEIVNKAACELAPEQKLDWLLVAARSIPSHEPSGVEFWTVRLWDDLFALAGSNAIAKPSNEDERRLQMKFLSGVRAFFSERFTKGCNYYYGNGKTHREAASEVARVALIAHGVKPALALEIMKAYCSMMSDDTKARQHLYQAMLNGPVKEAELREITRIKN